MSLFRRLDRTMSRNGSLFNQVICICGFQRLNHAARPSISSHYDAARLSVIYLDRAGNVNHKLTTTTTRCTGKWMVKSIAFIVEPVSQLYGCPCRRTQYQYALIYLYVAVLQSGADVYVGTTNNTKRNPWSGFEYKFWHHLGVATVILKLNLKTGDICKTMSSTYRLVPYRDKMILKWIQCNCIFIYLLASMCALVYIKMQFYNRTIRLPSYFLWSRIKCFKTIIVRRHNIVTVSVCELYTW